MLPMGRLLKDDLHKCPILIVDDSEFNATIIHTYLKNAGFEYIQVARDGQKAIEIVEEVAPDLMILDLVMPVMDGFEVLRRLKSDDRYKDIPIIVQTSAGDPDEQNLAWELGANDVLGKPIRQLELISRVNVQLRNTMLLRDLRYYHDMAENNILQGLELQRSLLPSSEEIQHIKERYRINIDFIFEPSLFLSGDLWGLVEIDDHSFGIWICDFSGKGIRAALNTFRVHTVVQELSDLYAKPDAFLEELNRRLLDIIGVGNFVTFIYGVIDLNTNMFNYSSASSMPPIIYNYSEHNFRTCASQGLPLGIVADVKYELRSEHIMFNDGLILYSDVLEERHNIPGVSFNESDLGEFISFLNGEKVTRFIRSNIQPIRQQPRLMDDLTIIEIYR